MNVVSNVLPFQRICDRAVNPLPFTIRGTEFKSPGMELGASDATCAIGAGPGQLVKATNAVQPSQPASNRVRTTTEAIWNAEKALAREERIPASLYNQAFYT